MLVLAIQPLVLGPVCSRAADIYGRKWLVITGAAAGTIGAIIVSRATSVGMAIAGQSIAGTAQATNSLVHAIMAEIVPRKYRTYAQAGVQGAVASGSLTAVYVAGAMCNNNSAGFRHFFYFVAALYFIAAIGFTFLYKPPVREFQVLTLREKLDKLDVYASLGTIVATLGICIALGWSQNPYDWHNAHILVPFVVGICGAIGVGLHARFIKKDGIYHHALFKSRNFMVAVTCIFAEGFGFLAFTNFVPFEISVVYGRGLFRTGLTLSIAWYACLIAAIIAGIFSAKTRTLRPPIVFSLTLMCTYFGAMAGLKLSSYRNIYGYGVFFGAALGATMNTIIVLAQLTASPDLTASVTGLMLAARGAGGTISLAASNAVFHASLSNDLVDEIAGAALSHGLPRTSLGRLIAALTSEDTVALRSIPGINGTIIGAAVEALKQAYLRAFSQVYIMAAAVCGFAAIGTDSINYRKC